MATFHARSWLLSQAELPERKNWAFGSNNLGELRNFYVTEFFSTLVMESHNVRVEGISRGCGEISRLTDCECFILRNFGSVQLRYVRDTSAFKLFASDAVARCMPVPFSTKLFSSTSLCESGSIPSSVERAVQWMIMAFPWSSATNFMRWHIDRLIQERLPRNHTPACVTLSLTLQIL